MIFRRLSYYYGRTGYVSMYCIMGIQCTICQMHRVLATRADPPPSSSSPQCLPVICLATTRLCQSESRSSSASPQEMESMYHERCIRCFPPSPPVAKHQTICFGRACGDHGYLQQVSLLGISSMMKCAHYVSTTLHHRGPSRSC